MLDTANVSFFYPIGLTNFLSFFEDVRIRQFAFEFFLSFSVLFHESNLINWPQKPTIFSNKCKLAKEQI